MGLFHYVLVYLGDMVVAYSILVSAPVLDLIGTWLGLGLAGFGTKGLGTGLDNKYTLYYSVSVV